MPDEELDIVESPGGLRAYMLNDQLHRLDGPALQYPDGLRAWHQHGQLHRLDGPAIERPDGTVEYWIYGVALTEDEYTTLQALPAGEQQVALTLLQDGTAPADALELAQNLS